MAQLTEIDPAPAIIEIDPASAIIELAGTGRSQMSDLIPNLGDLCAKLPAKDVAPDAHEFVEQLAKASTPGEVNANIDALVDRWLKVPDDSE
ncbi:hypothetical protein [Janibacter sp. LM]|uniref:hypothetical protein n=1 Tax=Janibacter sp. LM TaxID=3144845 RepID=UPI0031F71593